jgi:hypothetical protein
MSSVHVGVKIVGDCRSQLETVESSNLMSGTITSGRNESTTAGAV